jgi:hypothetical protein
LDVRSRGEELLSSDNDNYVHDHHNDRCRFDIVNYVNVDRDQCSKSESCDWNVREFRDWSSSAKRQPRRHSSWRTAHIHGVVIDAHDPSSSSRDTTRRPRAVVGDDDQPSR